jgi:hypothetical protein
VARVADSFVISPCRVVTVLSWNCVPYTRVVGRLIIFADLPVNQWYVNWSRIVSKFCNLRWFFSGRFEMPILYCLCEDCQNCFRWARIAEIICLGPTIQK